MLNTDPEQRHTIPKIRAHAWYRQIPDAAHQFNASDAGDRVLDEEVLEQLDRFGFPRDYAVKCVQMSKHNHVTTTYHLLVEKKRKSGGVLKAIDHDAHAGFEVNLSAGIAVGGREMELPAERTPSPYQGDPSTFGKPKISLDALGPGRGIAADADRAAGGSSPHAATSCPKTPENRGPHYGNWASAAFPGNLSGAPGIDHQYSARGEGRGADFRAAPLQGECVEPYISVVQSARGSSSQGPRRSYDGTPRGPPAGSGAAAVAAVGQTPRRPPTVTGMATPRATPSPGAGMQTPRGVTPPGNYRAGTPGRKPSGISDALGGIEPQRPGTSQGTNVPIRPPGPASSRSSHANEVRRRHYGVLSLIHI